jgi:hypothetical protein
LTPSLVCALPRSVENGPREPGRLDALDSFRRGGDTRRECRLPRGRAWSSCDRAAESLDGSSCVSSPPAVSALLFRRSLRARALPRRALGARDPSNVVLLWYNAALQGVRESKLGPPMVARAGNRPHVNLRRAGGLRPDRSRNTPGRSAEASSVRRLGRKQETGA